MPLKKSKKTHSKIFFQKKNQAKILSILAAIVTLILVAINIPILETPSVNRVAESSESNKRNRKPATTTIKKQAKISIVQAVKNKNSGANCSPEMSTNCGKMGQLCKKEGGSAVCYPDPRLATPIPTPIIYPNALSNPNLKTECYVQFDKDYKQCVNAAENAIDEYNYNIIGFIDNISQGNTKYEEVEAAKETQMVIKRQDCNRSADATLYKCITTP